MHKRDQLFTEIVQNNHASIYRICMAYLYDKSHADDLYQEILLQVWKSLDNYKGAAKLGTWVYRIAVNTAISYNISNKKRQHEALPEAINAYVDETEKEHKQEQEQQLLKLRKSINMLGEHDRLIISLVLEDLSYKDIAEITGSNTNHVGVKISRIKNQLLKLMEHATDERL